MISNGASRALGARLSFTLAAPTAEALPIDAGIACARAFALYGGRGSTTSTTYSNWSRVAEPSAKKSVIDPASLSRRNIFELGKRSLGGSQFLVLRVLHLAELRHRMLLVSATSCASAVVCPAEARPASCPWAP